MSASLWKGSHATHVTVLRGAKEQTFFLKISLMYWRKDNHIKPLWKGVLRVVRKSILLDPGVVFQGAILKKNSKKEKALGTKPHVALFAAAKPENTLHFQFRGFTLSQSTRIFLME